MPLAEIVDVGEQLRRIEAHIDVILRRHDDRRLLLLAVLHVHDARAGRAAVLHRQTDAKGAAYLCPLYTEIVVNSCVQDGSLLRLRFLSCFRFHGRTDYIFNQFVRFSKLVRCASSRLALLPQGDSRYALSYVGTRRYSCASHSYSSCTEPDIPRGNHF